MVNPITLAKPSSTREWYRNPIKPNRWLKPSQPEVAPKVISSPGIDKNILDDVIPSLRLFRREVEKEQEETVIDRDVEERFSRLASEWKQETAHISSMTALVMHPKYQNIIGMGPSVLPILFRELQENPDYWFWALRAITEEDPTTPEDAGNLERMAKAWLAWAKEHGYIINVG
jgi:hypothetical protein